MGPSGSGKSTFLRSLIGLEPSARLKWLWTENNLKLDLAREDVADRRLGVVFQDSLIFPHLTAEENLRLPEEAQKKNKAELFQKVVLSLGLKEILNTRGSGLSGGERQRVALGMALMTEPRMLLLDEPFSSLDQELRGAARKLLKNVVGEWKIPALVVSHDPTDATELASSVIQFPRG